MATARLKACPKCGQPEGLIYCPVCHKPRSKKPVSKNNQAKSLYPVERIYPSHGRKE